MGTTNVTPAHIDPRRLFVDVESLLGRAAAIGMQIVDLPPTFGDALMAWLRARALGFAQQQRTGIALGRDLLEKSHPEFSAFFVDTLPTETQRSAYVYLSWNFRAE